MKTLAISGSLRAGSFNTALLEAAQAAAPPGVEWQNGSISGLPLYDPGITDEVALGGVSRLRDQVRDASCVLIATPEYNYSIPGPLKNAIDWLSRPAYQSVFRDKPVGVMGASRGAVGAARAQQHLKQVLLGMAAQVFPYPEIALGGAPGKFDRGALVDAEAGARLARYMGDFAAWVEKVS